MDRILSNDATKKLKLAKCLESAETDLDTSSAITEGSLLSSSHNSSGTITVGTPSTRSSTQEDVARLFDNHTFRRRSGSVYILVLGIISISIGVLSLIWKPFDVLMTERLRMLPGLPPYEWWKNPPDEVLLRVYVFNITNANEFLSGKDTKINLQEIGPIIYREKLTHSDVVFNENSTLTYVAKRNAVYLPDMNTIDLNQTLILPNLAVLGMASYLSDSPFFVRLGFNVILNQLDSRAIINTTIYNYLWNMTDPILDVAQNLAPFLVPTKNMGMLNTIYGNFSHTVTVKVGAKHGHENFFMLEKFDGSEFLPGYADGEQCPDTIVNSTEGVMYNQYLTNQSVLKYWRKTLCRVAPLYYKREEIRFGVTAFEFELPNNTYDRVYDRTDCYKTYGDLPNGLSDISKCYYDFPIAASFPHFLAGDIELDEYVTGLTPNNSKHRSYVYVEPTTGVPIESRARSQSNLVIRKLSGFPADVNKFSNLVIPMFWAEYNQVGLPWYIKTLVYFTVNIVPIGQYFVTFFIFLSGLCCICVVVLRHRRGLHIDDSCCASPHKTILRRHKNLRINTTLVFEQEKFLKEKPEAF